VTTSPAEAFAALAEQFIKLLDDRERLTRAELLTRVHRLLPTLYAAGIALPEVHPDADVAERRIAGEVVQALRHSLGTKIGDGDLYAEIFDPRDLEAGPVNALLSDDLADIYGDLAKGLGHWKAGERDEAVWSWRFGLRIHWGEHATGAMRALYALVLRDGLE
jgi:uncharacterized protein DUF5063